MDQSVQNRRANHLQLRLFRHFDRISTARQCRLPRRQTHRMGFKTFAREKLPRSRAVHPVPLPQGLEDLDTQESIQSGSLSNFAFVSTFGFRISSLIKHTDIPIHLAQLPAESQAEVLQ